MTGAAAGVGFIDKYWSTLSGMLWPSEQSHQPPVLNSMVLLTRVKSFPCLIWFIVSYCVLTALYNNNISTRVEARFKKIMEFSIAGPYPTVENSNNFFYFSKTFPYRWVFIMEEWGCNLCDVIVCSVMFTQLFISKLFFTTFGDCCKQNIIIRCLIWSN